MSLFPRLYVVGQIACNTTQPHIQPHDLSAGVRLASSSGHTHLSQCPQGARLEAGTFVYNTPWPNIKMLSALTAITILVGAAMTGWWSRLGDLHGRKRIFYVAVLGPLFS
jgi:MFS family permease